ncbi:MAG: hypothetical protein JRH11_08160 [Deltaproteobacteria bacterium]|nr:hypothetical protein [Deltaproteobacteria bacterium]
MSYYPPKPDENGSPSRRPPAPEAASPPDRVDGTGEGNSPDREDLLFINKLSAVGLLGDLGADELKSLLASDAGQLEVTRHLDMLTSYYSGAGDHARGVHRCVSDRFYLLSDQDVISGKGIVSALAALSPEVGEISMERIGSDDGPLVLRCGDHVAAIVDEYEESLDTDEIDLRDLDERASVTAQSIVQAVNALLDRYGAERRFVPLLGDFSREAYVAVTEAGAVDLCRAGFLELESQEQLFEHCVFDD